MAFISKEELYDLYLESVQEKHVWQENYPEYERLMNNEIIADLDENLPEVNDGTLSASLYKLPKRLFNSKLTGRAKALDRDDAWLTELANIRWENEIIPNANMQAPFARKWKDAIRKSAGYGSVPLVTMFVNHGQTEGADFYVGQPQDWTLEAGKVSDYDCQVIFGDLYFTRTQLKDMIEEAKEDAKDPDSYKKWNIELLEKIYAAKNTEDRDSRDVPDQKQGKAVTRGGYHFMFAPQRGVGAPFCMYHSSDKKNPVCEWENPDPTGDLPVHYLYCYQDFINPYGVGIVKLAGGTQNTLDYYTQADILATQLGLERPVIVRGNADDADIESMVYERKAVWMTGQAEIDFVDTGSDIYSQLPDRISMKKIQLNQMIPTGDTSIAAGAGDQDYSKTPAGVEFQKQNLSIDDEDYKDNIYMTYEAKAKSMINYEFANMQGTDLMKLSDEERDILAQSGLEFPIDEQGNPTNELEIIWDEARAQFNFKIDPDQDKTTDEDKRLEGLMKVAELRASDPNLDAYLQASGKKMNVGELFADIISLTSDNEKIIEDITPEDQAALDEQAQVEAMGMGEATEEVLPPEVAEGDQQESFPGEAEAMANMQAVMDEYGVDELTALSMLDAEFNGEDPDEIVDSVRPQE